jgi:excisionase family DNA binding protein
MATRTTSMTTSEFAKAAGVSAASISKLIRDGKLKARKEGGKWLISRIQVDSKVVRALKKPAKAGKSKPARQPSAPMPPVSQGPGPVQAPADHGAASADPPEPETRAEEKTYTISEFAAMTYLTEKGVSEWLKSGRIKGVQEANGEWRVLGSNLQVPDISRLLRK